MAAHDSDMDETPTMDAWVMPQVAGQPSAQAPQVVTQDWSLTSTTIRERFRALMTMPGATAQQVIAEMAQHPHAKITNSVLQVELTNIVYELNRQAT